MIAAIWMLSGLSGGLAPSMVRSVFLLNSGLLNGLSGFIAPATSAVIGLAFARLDPRRAMTIGIYASIAGAGFGASFTASLRLIFPLAAAHQRAGVVAGIYIVSYIAFGVPIVIAGQLAGPLGLVPTVFWYSAVTVLLALISLRAQLQLRRSTRSVIGLAPSSDLQTSGASMWSETIPLPVSATPTPRIR